MHSVSALARLCVISTWFRRNNWLVLLPGFLATLATSAFATDTGALASGTWETSAIWTGGATPGASDNVYIGSVYPTTPGPQALSKATVTLTANESVTNLNIGYGSPTLGTLDLGTRKLTITGTLWIGRFAGGYAAIQEEGGSFTTGSLLLFNGNALTMGASDVATVIDIENAGTVLTTTSTGNITNGGAIANGATLNLGANLNVGSPGALNVESTGATTALNMNGHNVTAPLLDLGYYLTAAVTLNRGGSTKGTLTLSNLQIGNGQNLSLLPGDVIDGVGGTGVGAIDIYSGATLTTAASSNVTTTVNVVDGTLNLGADMSIGNQTVNAANGSIVNLAGHSLACSYLLLGYSGSSTVTLNRSSGSGARAP